MTLVPIRGAALMDFPDSMTPLQGNARLVGVALATLRMVLQGSSAVWSLFCNNLKVERVAPDRLLTRRGTWSWLFVFVSARPKMESRCNGNTTEYFPGLQRPFPP